MITKIKVVAFIILSFSISTFIYSAAQLTKALESDILDIDFDEEEF